MEMSWAVLMESKGSGGDRSASTFQLHQPALQGSPFPTLLFTYFFFIYFQCNCSKSNTCHQVGCRLQSHLQSLSSSSSGAHLPPSSPKPWHQSVAPYGHPTSFTVNLSHVAVFVAGVLLDPDTRPLTLPESRISKSRRTPTFCASISPANIRDSQR